MATNVINDLYDYGLKIVQNPDYFKFSLDSILLADFVKIKYTDKTLIDLCSGNSPLPMILSGKIDNITAIELQPEIYEMAKDSIKINEINNINLINDDIKNWSKYIQPNSFDILTVNPPYFKVNEGANLNNNDIKSIARHEIKTNLEEIINISKRILKNKGYFYIVYRTERLIELIELLQKYKFGIKKMQFCYETLQNNCSLVLIEAMSNGKDDLKVLPPIISNNLRGE